MKVFSSIPNFYTENKSIITIGTFDGVHLGHKVILARLKEITKKTKQQSVLLTFFPHPRYVLQKDDQEMKLINTLKEKQDLLAKQGLDNLVVHEFTKKFSRIKSANFVRDILVEKLKVHTLVIGHNHHFGRNREGSILELTVLAELYGFNIEMIPPQLFQDVAVSSTKIRNFLGKGKIEKANQYLGYDFSLSGKVIKGNSIGKTIGFPTANIKLEDKYKLQPADGVYAVKVIAQNKEYKGMMNIGMKPTVDGEDKSLEVNIFDFSDDIYGKEIKVLFIKRIRDEKKFEDLYELKKQLIIDKNKSVKILG
ncbi:MAG: bifunctional riboflavin kinase/FAD synthetase [Flavobacteriales bacterium]|nr:bifunctional riboflavin kinase/FAD synthetase [Flavobacteriales bacterium]